MNFHDIRRSHSALSQVSAWHALDHKPLLLPHISHGSTSWILIFENLPFQFSTDQTRLRLLKKVLILHAEKGLVRAGTPDLTLFHQVRSTNMHQIAKSPTCTKSTNHPSPITKSPNTTSTTSHSSHQLFWVVVCSFGAMGLSTFPILPIIRLISPNQLLLKATKNKVHK